jgi:hypothetical protein
MANNKVQKRKYVIGLLVLLAMATVSTYAWSMDETLNTETSQVYVTSNAGTDVTITSFKAKPIGKNKVQITFTTDEDCEMSFGFLNSTTGDLINVNRDVTMDIAGGGAADCTEDATDYTWAAPATVTAGNQVIVIERATGQTDQTLWKDLDTASVGNQTYGGLMIIIE